MLALDLSRQRRGAAWIGLAVLALHLLVLAMLSRAPIDRRDHAPPERISVRIVAPPRALPSLAEPSPATLPPGAPRPLRVRHAGRAVPRADAQRAAPAPLIAPTPAEAVPSAPTHAARAEPAASDASHTPSLLDTEATRRAIHASALTPSLGERLARSRDESRHAAASSGERLASEVRAAGRGDCSKGEYVGAGMGLLSLPFLAAAAVAGHCAR